MPPMCSIIAFSSLSEDKQQSKSTMLSPRSSVKRFEDKQQSKSTMLSPRSVPRNNLFTRLMKKLMSPSDSKKKNSRTEQVARGCVAIYVGEERKRYQVPLTYLSLPTFQELIKRSNDDDAFDVKIDGPITVACATQAFDRLLKIAKKTAS